MQSHLATWLELAQDESGRSAPKRLRYFLQADPAIQSLALHIFLSAVEQGLQAACPGAQGSTARIGAVAFIDRCGALLNPHVHFHCVVVDGVFEAGTGGELPVRFHEMPALDAQQLAVIQYNIRRRLLRALTWRGVLESDVAEEMAAWDQSGGFSLDAGVRIEAEDRPGLERLLRYCARPVFALERLRQVDPEDLVYESLKPGPGGSVSLLLTPLELIERLAALIPPPRRHRHRYYGVLAPNSPLRTAVTALAAEKGEATQPTAMTETVPATEPGAPEEPAHRKAARYVWALLLARIYEVLPLACPKCGGDMRIIAFINEGPVTREILGHLGEPISAPSLAPARGPPLWEMLVAGPVERETDPLAQPASARARPESRMSSAWRRALPSPTSAA